MSKNLSELERVNIRNLWPNEAADFTPWLSEPDNIARLAEVIGMDRLEIEGVEVPVGRYSADILARDTSSEKFVVVENQFGKTDHDHLGKGVTYASVLDAGVVVWIAETFNPEHKKALDWLNDHTTEDVAFYGVVVELWKIDDSRPAVRFNVVSEPADIVRDATAVKAAGPLTETQKLQLDFWTAFRDRLLEKRVVASIGQPRGRYWFNVPLGRTGIILSNTVDTWSSRIGVRVYLHSRSAPGSFPQLLEQRNEIEAELGEQLQWDPNENAKDKTIVLTHDVDLNDRTKWPEYVDWMVNTTAKFRKVFMPRVKELDLSGDEGE